jgi:hypothetical protein
MQTLEVIRVSDPDLDPDWIRIQSGQWIRIRIRIHALNFASFQVNSPSL